METARQTKTEKEKELCFKKLLYACIYLYDDIGREEEEKLKTQETSPAIGKATTCLTP